MICKLCQAEGHEMSGCPHLEVWLRMKFSQKPGLSFTNPKAIWRVVWGSAFVFWLAIMAWRWL